MAEKPLSDFNFLLENSNLSTTKKLSYDDLGDFTHERLKIERKFEKNLKTSLKLDYSDFKNHTFFNSAVSKLNIAKDRVLNEYPFNGSTEDIENFILSGSGYENYIFDQWPRFVGFLQLNGTDQYVSASDNRNNLLLGTSSLYVSAWLGFPKISNQNIILQVVSASSGPVLKHGYDFYLSGATDPHIKFSLYSGSSTTSVSAAYSAYTSSWNNVSVIYDQPAGFLSLYINNSKRVSSSLSYNSIQWKPIKAFIGSGSQYSASYSNYDYYSGSLDEIRIFHTASEIYHNKAYNNSIASENFLKLRYSLNEGIVGTSSIDLNVIDYSRNALHGVVVNYTSTSKISGSSMTYDFGDPILYSFHSGVIDFTSSIDLSASQYDKDNRNIIFNLIPESSLREDEKQDKLLQAFALVMARYFDEIKSYIDQFENLRTTNYDNIDETPDLFLTNVLKYFGWNATQHFDSSNPLEFLFGEKIFSSGSLSVTPMEIRNQFWKRILNNVSYFFKSKGKRHSVDALFNVLGINKNLIGLKEYGFIPDKTSIENIRIHKEKDVYFLGIGTGSLSSSFIKVPSLITSSNSEYTVETLIQLPFISASYSASINEVTGSVWQFVDSNLATGSFGLFWKRNNATSASGTFVLSGSTAAGVSSGGTFSSSIVPVFDGRFVYVAAGLSSSQRPFIELRSIENDSIIFSSSNIGSVALSGVFTGSKYDFIVGGNSGSILTAKTHGFFGEARFWTRSLSGSEIDDHALNFESIGIQDPLIRPNPLKLRLALNENKTSDSTGVINRITDLSNNSFIATGSQFLSNHNPYKKFLLDMNYLSPTMDLRWNENKIRIRNKSELKLNEIAKDTNEVALEFNLVDSLNEDISKIFSTFDVLNNVIGAPINKYRDEYSDLESYRRIYFQRLSREINFTSFFKLFKWFDKKIGVAIKQLLPIRTKFIGGEFVVESHFLERNKYGYKYPIFRTPKDVAEGVIASGSGIVSFCGSYQNSLQSANAMKGTYVATEYEKNSRRTSNAGLISPYVSPRDESVSVGTVYPKDFQTTFSDGDEKVDRSVDALFFTLGYVTVDSGYMTVDSGYASSIDSTLSTFFRKKLSGDENINRDRIGSILNPNVGINWKNEFTRRQLSRFESLNFDGYSAGFKTGSFIHPKIGVNANVMNDLRSSNDNQQYLGSYKKYIGLSVRFLSGAGEGNFTFGSADYVSSSNDGLIKIYNGNGTATLISGTLWDQNNVLLERNDIFFDSNFFFGSGTLTAKMSAEFSLEVSNSIGSSTGTSFDNELQTTYVDGINYWSPGLSIFLYSRPEDIIRLSDGFTKFIYRFSFPSGSDSTSFPLTLLSSSGGKIVYLRLSGQDHGGNTVTSSFRNIRLDFLEPLSDIGVKYYQKIDNTNNEFVYINRNVMPGIE